MLRHRRNSYYGISKRSSVVHVPSSGKGVSYYQDGKGNLRSVKPVNSFRSFRFIPSPKLLRYVLIAAVVYFLIKK